MKSPFTHTPKNSAGARTPIRGILSAVAMAGFFSLTFMVPAPMAGAGEPAQGLKSFIPKEKAGEFVAAKLDLTTFRNSFGPRRAPGLIHFADFGMKPKTATDEKVEFDDEEWSHAISIVSRRDVNGDGLEDLVITYSEQAKKGSYRDSQKLLITRYSEGGNLIALAYSP